VWLQTSKNSVIELFGKYKSRPVISSSKRDGSYKAKWYNRPKKLEDPWISLGNYDANNKSDIVYGGAKVGLKRQGRIPRDHNGANVYIRDRLGCCIERGASKETCKDALALNSPKVEEEPGDPVFGPFYAKVCIIASMTCALYVICSIIRIACMKRQHNAPIPEPKPADDLEKNAALERRKEVNKVPLV